MATQPRTGIDFDQHLRDDSAHKMFAMIVGIASLLILLQGLWAGLMFDKALSGGDASTWQKIHAHAGEVAILLAVVSFVWALVKLKHRKDLIIGSGMFALAMIIEWFAGHQMADANSNLLWLHIPLALISMSLSVWLPLRSRHAIA